MPNLNVGLIVVVAAGDALADTVYSGACTTQTAVAQYYSVVNGGIERYSGISNIPAIGDIYPGCTAGTYYKIYPTNTIDGYPDSFTNSSMYKSLFGVLYSCTSCADGYELADYTAPYEYRYNAETVSCTSLTGASAVKWCSKTSDDSGGGTTTSCTSSNCTSSGLSAYSTGYLVQTYRQCVNNECVESTRYVCDKGYFGPSQYLTEAWGCVKCPGYYVGGNSYSTTTNATAVPTVEGCYVEAVGDTTEFKDGAGTYVFSPYSDATNYCYYDFGSCENVTPACTTSAGTMYAVVDGTKTHSSAGTYCWCNVNGKSFYFTSQSTASACAASCGDMCSNALFGFAANAGEPLVSLTDLGCE